MLGWLNSVVYGSSYLVSCDTGDKQCREKDPHSTYICPFTFSPVQDPTKSSWQSHLTSFLSLASLFICSLCHCFLLFFIWVLEITAHLWQSTNTLIKHHALMHCLFRLTKGASTMHLQHEQITTSTLSDWDWPLPRFVNPHRWLEMAPFQQTAKPGNRY